MHKWPTIIVLGVLVVQSTALARGNPFNQDHGPFEDADWPQVMALDQCDGGRCQSGVIAGFNIRGHYYLKDRPEAPRLLTARHDDWRGWWLFVLSAEHEVLAEPACIAKWGPAGSTAWWGHLNADGKEDFVVNTYLGGCGSIYTTSSYVTFVLSNPKGYTISSTIGQWSGPDYFVDIDHDGQCEFIHTRFTDGHCAIARDGKRHNYWVYNILKVQGDRLILRNDLAPQFPKWIWYTYGPNHQATTMITEEQKRALWAKHEPAIFWTLDEGPIITTVSRVLETRTCGDPFIIVFDPKRRAVDYRAPASCSLPEDDPYVVARGGWDKLVWTSGEPERTAREYVIPREKVRAVFDVYEGSVITTDCDIIFTNDHVIRVNRSNGSGGIFSGCVVWETPNEQAWDAYRRWREKRDPGEVHLVHEVMDFYANRIRPALEAQAVK